MQQSGQTYLETIYLLKRENGRVKSIDVAKALGFPSRVSAVQWVSSRQKGIWKSVKGRTGPYKGRQ